MILFDLHCSRGHGFEAWFRDGDSFDRLAAVGEIQCAVCGDTKIKKALMAPNISPSKTADGRMARDEAEDTSPPPPGAGEPETTAAMAGPPPMAVQENA
ncbi:MAG: DUF1178 family protein, partial [Alphaproteobacteria bacterium]|nr:DUF1178 family protein [Alphaproteobacteria bacterium]